MPAPWIGLPLTVRRAWWGQLVRRSGGCRRDTQKLSKPHSPHLLYTFHGSFGVNHTDIHQTGSTTLQECGLLSGGRKILQLERGQSNELGGPCRVEKNKENQ
jgi:hypothetical protein